jgi:predicted dinucleotide-binding enzyme
VSTGNLTIAVLGGGNIGGTLGRKWVAAGHPVAFGVNDPDGPHARTLRSELGDQVNVGSLADALDRNPDVVLMAIPGAAMDVVIPQHGALLDGCIIIDAANRLGGGPMNSFATLQQHTARARLYRAFNTLGWENFADPNFGGVQADLFYCGTDGESRAVVEQLIGEVGLRPIYLGGVEQVDLVDSVLRLWFTLSRGQGWGRHFAFKVLSQ